MAKSDVKIRIVVDGDKAVSEYKNVQKEIQKANKKTGQSQKKLADESKLKLAKSGKFEKPIVTEVTAMGDFYPAEDYHQDYYQKNPIRYKYYRSGSGRDQFLEKVWKKSK